MANDKKRESLSSLQASTERYKRHNDRVSSGAKFSKVVVPIDLYEVPLLGRKLHGDELSSTEAMGNLETMKLPNREQQCTKCRHWQRGVFGDRPCPVGGEHSWLSVTVSDSPVGVMTGAQAVAAMTGAGVPVEQVELTKVIAELEASWLKLDAVLKRCRVLLETMKGKSDG